jgi:WD40 repeat protein
MFSVGFPENTQTRRVNWPRVFGYDFFISFKLGSSPLGTQRYAADLAYRLNQLGFTVFFSEEEAPPGEKLDSTLVTNLHLSKILVVIVNEGAILHSQWIRREVEEFRRKHPHRKIIPINVDNAFEQYGLQANLSDWLHHDDKIWLNESKQSVEEGKVSDELLTRLLTAPNFIRSNTRLNLAIITILLTLTGLSVLAFFKALDANQKFIAATANRLIQEVPSLISGTTPEGTTIGLFKLLAGHKLSENTNAYDMLQETASRFKRMIYLRNNFSEATSVSFSPNGKRIATGGTDGTVKIWDAETGQLIGQPLKGHDRIVWSVAFSPDSQRIVSGSLDNTLRLWDVNDGHQIGLPFKGHENRVASVAFSPDGKRIVSSSFDKTIRLWNADTGELIGQPLRGHENIVMSVAFSPDGQRIASASFDNTLRLWDIGKSEPIGAPIEGHSDAVLSVAFSPDGRRLVSGSKDRTVRIWNVDNGQLIGSPLLGHDDSVLSVAFSPDGRRIVSASVDKTLRLWDAETSHPINEIIQGHEGAVLAVAFSPGGNRLASVSSDKTLRLWAIESNEVLKGHTGYVSSVVYSPDGQKIASASYDKTIRIWNIHNGQPIGQPLIGHGDIVYSVAFSPNGRQVVSGSKDTTLRVWDVETGQTIGEPLKGHQDAVSSVAFNFDSSLIVSGSADKTLRLWDSETHQPKIRPIESFGMISCVAFNPSDNKIISCITNNVIKDAVTERLTPEKMEQILNNHILQFWDTKTGREIGQPFKGHAQPIVSVAISSDGRHIVSGSVDKTLRLWDSETYKTIGEPLQGHDQTVWGVAFSPDGQYIASGSWDKTLRLWDTKTGHQIGKPLKGHGGPVWGIAFSPDGKHIASGSSDETLRIWPVLEGWADELCNKLGRNMTLEEWRDWIAPDIDYATQCPAFSAPTDKPQSNIELIKTMIMRFVTGEPKLN